MPVNKAIDLDIKWVNSINVSEAEVISKVASAKFTDKDVIAENSVLQYLTTALNSVDLASLVGNETPESIHELCKQAAFPLEVTAAGDAPKLSNVPKSPKITCAAICIYPLRIEDATKSLIALNADKTVRLAAVAAGFPTGQFPLHTRVAEIYYAVAKGAQEIDVVIDRSLVLRGLWPQLYAELVQMREACGEAELKVILSVVECGGLTNVYKASVVAMLAGADFIKTSTGKEGSMTTMHEGLVMCRAIKDFYQRTGVKVGLKPAGGVRSAEQAISWMLMVKQELGDEWVDPKLFRIGSAGTSALVGSIANAISKLVK